MRKLSLFVVALVCSQFAFAQKGLEVGINFTPTNTWILNNEDFGADQDLDFRATFNYNVGITAGLNLTDGLGISTGLIIVNHSQKYITNYDNRTKDEQNLSERSLSYVRVPILLKLSGDPTASSSAFFRVGPFFDFISKARYTYDDKSMFNLDSDLNMLNRTDMSGNELSIYNKKAIGLMVEFGGQSKLMDNLHLFYALQLASTLTNTEGEHSNRYYPSENASITNLYGDQRSTAYNASVGLTVGLKYTLSVGK